MDNQRNFILAAVLSLIVVFGWQMLIVQPRIEAERQAAELQRQQLEASGQTAQPGTSPTPSADPAIPSAPPAAQSGATEIPGQTTPQDQADATGTARRIPLMTEKLEGSINLRGARVDDLRLRDYHETVDRSSPIIRLLAPAGNQDAYFAEFGFSPDENLSTLPGPTTEWQLTGGDELTATSPIELTFENERGLVFTRQIAVDDNYMFTVTDTVTNQSGDAVAIRPYGRIARYGEPDIQGIYVLHEGLIGSVGDQGLDEIDYDDIEEDKQITRDRASTGWLGITDKYWATALIPSAPFVAHYNYFDRARSFYQTDFLADAVSVPAGGTATHSARLFAGAKIVSVIDAYEADLDIPLFDKIIDWGWFYWLTKPLFYAIDYFFHLFGNFGVAILVVTVLVKLLFFPLASKSYASMARMKMVQPEMTAIRERFADDRQAQQQAMMKLYKEKKINPAAGCWPVLIQIPVFFALYKVLYVTIEMRHAPFFGWIEDLSAPDPTSIFNLFGLLPYDVPLFLMIGVWPLLMGITMFIQMQMNPAPPDPTQQMIFRWMPVVFTFMLATFPAGLVIYWAWNNFLSILQQGAIMKRQGAKIELWDNLKGMFSRQPKDE